MTGGPAPRFGRLRLTAFRGATGVTAVAFDPDKPLTLLYGGNGAGKSTVVDAIDAVCNGRAGSLAERSSTSVREHLPSAGRDAADLLVELTAGAATWRATLAGGAIATDPPYDGPPVHVLRRGLLLDLVNAAPAARYAVVQGFVDVGGVERAERALGEAAKEAADAVKLTAGALAQARASLDDLWAREGRPGEPPGPGLGQAAGDPEAWAEAQAATDLTDLAARAERAQALAGAAERLDTAEQRYAAAHADVEVRRRGREDAERVVAAIGAGAYGAGLAALLGDVARLLDTPAGVGRAGAVAECPVCERPTEVAALRARVAERLAASEALTAALGRAGEAARASEAAERADRVAGDGRVGAARALAALMDPARLDDGVLRGHVLAVRALPAEAEVTAGALEDVAALAGAAVGVRARAGAVANRLQQQIGKADAVRAALSQVHAKTDELVDARRLHERLTALQAAVREERLAFVQETLDAVAEESNRLYERVHPGEGLRLRRLWLDPKRRGSLLQEAEFAGGAGAPPQAYFSESHLDTLGFCFWLAITKRAAAAGGAPPVVVLDDAFASTDAEHGSRILALLAEEAGGLTQLVVATHQRDWLEAARGGAVDAALVDVVELGAWTPGRGIAALASR